MILAQHTLETTALPENVWARWADVASYPEWDEGVESARLDGEFKVGACGVIKPKGGRPASFKITEVEEFRTFADQTLLLFARLRFSHKLEATDMGTRFTHVIQAEGPLAWVWSLILSPKLKTGLSPAMRKLARLAEIHDTRLTPENADGEKASKGLFGI